MSLITSCPACGTMFKVVPDQLRISEGWVRCGHCSEVFDASASLLQEGVPVSLPGQGAQAAPPAATQAPSPATPPEPQVEPFDPFVDAPAQEEPQPPQQAKAPPQADLDPSPRWQEEVESLAAESIDPEEPRSSLDPEPDLEDVSFVRQARRKAFWARPGVRAGLAFVGLALALLLGLQFAVHDRDRLAAVEPSLRPLLEALCEPLACKVGPPRQIEAIAIDSSSFTKLRGEAYRLNFTLKNQAGNEVAMPAVELTLTDAQDQPVLRRVLTPADLGAKSPIIEASSEWSGTLALAVAANGGPRVAGYRVLAFYP